jgi:gas vesicle protein
MLMKFKKDNSVMTAVAAIAGLAVGTAIALLLAPKSGKEVRSFILDLVDDLTGEQKPAATAEIKDHLVEDVRAQVKEAADHLAGEDTGKIDPVKNTLKQTGPKSRQIPAEEI